MNKSTPPNKVSLSKNQVVGLVLLAVMSTLTFIIFVGVSSNNNAELKKITATTGDNITLNKVISSQQVAKTSAFTVSISDVTETDKKDPAFAIEDNETFLIAKINITNNSSSFRDLFPVTQIYVRSSDGSYYQLHPSMNMTEPLGATKLAPGQTASGQIAFAIPKILARPLLYVDLGWEDYVPVVYDVLN